jgi:hypothetical protein
MIDRDAMARYILIAQKSYRPEVPYHNWNHAISVTHFAYLLMKHVDLSPYCSKLESDMVRPKVLSASFPFCSLSFLFIQSFFSPILFDYVRSCYLC